MKTVFIVCAALFCLSAAALYLMDGGKSKKKRRKAKALRPDVRSNDGVEMEYPIAGINFRGLEDKYLGDFNGYLKAETNNAHDPYAVAVYVGRKQVGYAPKGDAELHARVLCIGTMPCYGYIAKGTENGKQFYYGRFYLDV